MLLRPSLTTGILALGSLVTAAPCDIYAQGGVPCVAAHSTTRSLYKSFNGALYQIVRGSDGTTINISPLSAGGVANSAAQDSFCKGTTCLITTIYDQSGQGNHLKQAPAGAFNGPDVNGADNLAAADGAPVTLNGKKAYGIFVSPGTGYRIDNGNGIATGDNPEGLYAVFDGTHYNDACCFDYGNAETSNHDTGNGHMEAIYYGNSVSYGKGAGNGPWVMADLENGLFSDTELEQNNADPSQSNRFVTAIVKGNSGNHWSLRAANAQAGSVSTYYSGPRSSAGGYNPMHKEGSIILGIGGDNSNGAQGTFYEGVMTSGYPSDGTENLVQNDIVQQKYNKTSLISGTALTVGSAYSFRVTTPGFNTRYLAHSGNTIDIQVVTSSNSTTQKQSASWTVRAGLGNSDCISFESRDTPGNFIRHSSFHLILSSDDGSKQMHEDATFCPQSGLNGQGTSIRSWNYPTRYVRHYYEVGYVASNGGVQDFDNVYSFNNDVSYAISSAFA